MTRPTQASELPKLPTLPQSLINLIGEYGMARTDGLNELDRLALWESLIVGIKDYARANQAADSVPVAAGLKFAADFIDKRAQEYLDGNAGTEHDTGAITWHYGEAGRDYYNTLTELAEELRGLHPSATTAPIAAVVAPEGWKFSAKDDEEDRTWLTITTPYGACAMLSCRSTHHNGQTIAAQVVHLLAAAPAHPVAAVALTDEQIEAIANRFLIHGVLPNIAQHESLLVEFARAVLAAAPASPAVATVEKS